MRGHPTENTVGLLMRRPKPTTDAFQAKGGVAVSKRSEACKIDKSVKDAVFERDGGCCVWCGRSGPYVLPEAHFVSRAKGGKGIEQNILTLCRYTCHERFDHGDRNDRENMRERFREYLKSKYPDWDETKLYYKNKEVQHGKTAFDPQGGG